MSDFLFQNARVKALENRLLDESQIQRLLDASNITELYKILVEYGFGGATVEGSGQFDRMFVYEENWVSALLKELATGTVLMTFLRQNDFHNLKALVKAREMKIEEPSFMLACEGTTEITKIKEALESGDYRSLPDQMKYALEKIDAKKLNGELSPRIIDTVIDKAMFADIFVLLEGTKEKSILDYFQKTVDTINLSLFLRFKGLGLPEKQFEEAFIEGGLLVLSDFVSIFEQPLENFREKFRYSDYSRLVDIALDGKGLIEFEVERDNILLRIFKKDRQDMFSVAPVAGFYIGKLTEVKTVKLIVAAVKNNVDKKIAKQRMRELYA